MKTKTFFAVLVSAFALLMAGCEGLTDGNGNNGSGFSDVTFDISISDITTSGAVVSVVPSDETVLYYFDKVTKEEYDGYKGDNNAFMEAMVENLRSYAEESGSSLATALSVGEDSHTYNNELSPATNYYIFAFSLDNKLNPNSDLTLKAFTTENVQMSNNTFQIMVEGGLVAVSPSNNDPYFWTVEPSDLYKGQTDEFIMNDLIDYYSSEGYLEYYISEGESSFDYITYLNVGESYTVYAFGYDGMPTTGLTKYTFTYEGNGSSGGEGDEGDYATTTLTGNVTLNIADVEAYYYGDFYDIGTNNWEIGFFNSTGYEFVFSEFFTALNATTPEGTYTITANAGNVNTAYSGEFYDDTIYPTYYAKLTQSENLEAMALIASGSFSIAKSGSNYTVNLNLADILGNKVTGSYTGSIYVAKGEIEEEAVQASAGKRAHRRAARNTLRRFSSAAKMRPAATVAPTRTMRTK